MTQQQHSQPSQLNQSHGVYMYTIRVQSELRPSWAGWFADLTLIADNGTTLMTGAVVDQAALYGLLKKIRDLGLPLISVNREALPLSDGGD